MTLATAAVRNGIRTWKSRRYDTLIGTAVKITIRRFAAAVTTSIAASLSTNTSLRNSLKTPLHVTFVNRNGDHLTVDLKEGQTLLDAAINKDLNLEGFGACGGSLACSTCHVIMQEADFARVEKRMSEEERDLLDLSPHFSPTSRLGCQVVVTRALDGMVVRLPTRVSDARELKITRHQLDAADQ